MTKSVFTICALLLAINPVFGQAPSEHAIWNGVYSPAQADRGRVVVTTLCTRCHGQNRPLIGDLFMLHWEGHTLARLWNKIKTMPPTAASDISDQDKLDALAHVLQQNGFPPGATDLAPDQTVLEGIRIVPEGGPRPMRSGAVVQVIGCLSRGSSNSWMLINGTEPAATVLEDDDAERQSAIAAALGAQSFQLLSVFPNPSAYVDHKVRVKGLLIRNPAGDRINVVSLQTLAPACGP